MTSNAKFENILDLEFTAKSARGSVALMPSNTPLWLRESRHAEAARAMAALYAAVESLTPDEAREYGTYRLATIQKYGWR